VDEDDLLVHVLQIVSRQVFSLHLPQAIDRQGSSSTRNLSATCHFAELATGESSHHTAPSNVDAHQVITAKCRTDAQYMSTPPRWSQKGPSAWQGLL
jgi:hypothetical protein